MTIDYEDYKNLSWNIDSIKKIIYRDIPEDIADAIKELNKLAGTTYELVYKKVLTPMAEERERVERERSIREDLRFDVKDNERDLIDSVLGQLSDGYWENYSKYSKYWRNISLDGNTVVVNSHLKWDKMCENETAVRAFFAEKATIVQKADLKYRFGTTRIKGHENEPARYLDRGVNITYGDVQEAIESLTKTEK